MCYLIWSIGSHTLSSHRNALNYEFNWVYIWKQYNGVANCYNQCVSLNHNCTPWLTKNIFLSDFSTLQCNTGGGGGGNWCVEWSEVVQLKLYTYLKIVFRRRCGILFSNLDYSINYAFCSSQIFSLYPRNTEPLHNSGYFSCQ